MQNNYLLESSDTHTLFQKEKEIIKKHHFENQYQAIYDLEENSLSSALEDLDTYSFFSPKKTIIIRNAFLDPNDKNLPHLLKYIENSSPDNLLIMTSHKLDSRTNLVKEVKKNKNIDYIKIEIEPKKFVEEKLDSYQISANDIIYLIERCKKDITMLNSECEKLMSYKIKDKTITREDIHQLVIEKLGDANEILFSMTNSIMKKDKKKALAEYQELKKYQTDPYAILGLLASQIRLIHQVKRLKEENMTNQEIADILEIKSVYRIKKIAEYSSFYSYQDIYDFTHLLADTDLKLKTGKIDPSIAIEIFIITQKN